MRSNQAKSYRRDEQGFTLAFAVILCLIFATLLSSVYYFLGLNTKNAFKGITKLQTMYLAESGNNRALSRLNVKSLPQIEVGELSAEEEEEEAGDEDDEFVDEEDLEDIDLGAGLGDDLGLSDEDEEFLAKIPRYINFYHKNPYFVNIDTGQRITEAQYYAMIQAQQLRLKKIREESDDPNDINGRTEIPIQELYFPLPEVNVQKIGSIPVEKGVHLKPGFRVVLAEKSPVKLKQANIVDEYFNYVPEYVETRAKPVLRGISPNYAYPGEYVDIRLDGDNIETIVPEISSADIVLMDSRQGLLSVDINEKIKPGRYTIKLGPAKAEFYIVPPSTKGNAPSISDVRLGEARDGNPQFIKMFSKDSLEGVKIIGQDLSDGRDAPVIVVDGLGVTVDIISHRASEIVCNIKTDKAIPGSHYLTIYTKGGSSNSWIFNVDKTPADVEIDPFTGTYTTVLTLMEVNSLSNLPLKSIVESSPSGRPQKGGAGGRATSGTQDASKSAANPVTNANKSFDLLRSDLETVWKLETIATVNRVSYKETQIVRRSAPRAGAALITNTGLSFGQSSLVISGKSEAVTNLVESTSPGDTKIEVTGVDPTEALFAGRDDNKRPSATPTGKAVIENLGLGVDPNTPKGKGFTPGAIIAINSSRRGGQEYSDYAILQTTGGNNLVVKDPGFRNSHFLGDEVVQFVPAVITPDELNERDAQRGLEPPGSFINLGGKTAFDYVFRTRLDRISNWSDVKTTSTSVPNDIKMNYEGYFGLNIIEGVPDYTGGNALYGQGALIIDTTLDGKDPSGGMVTIGGSSKLPSLFDGLIYIIGNLQITGPTEIRGAIIVQSPVDGSSIRIGGSGTVSYDLDSIHKAILHLPFTTQVNSRVMAVSKGQDEILKKDK